MNREVSMKENFLRRIGLMVFAATFLLLVSMISMGEVETSFSVQVMLSVAFIFLGVSTVLLLTEE